MAQNLLACDRDQQLLLAPDMREWLPDDHLAWFVLDAVKELDLTDFYAAYRDDGQGAAAHDPEMMVALFLYSYAIGETSSRAIERRLREDVAFRIIGANRAPDHTTIARFRSRHQDALAELFTQILDLCRRAGLVPSKTVAIDGTKLQANASLDANRTRQEIQADVERYLKEAERVDRLEDEIYGDKRGDELPEHLADPTSRRQALRRAKEELDREEAKRKATHDERVSRYQDHLEKTGRRPRGAKPSDAPPKPRKIPKRNLTDLDSRIVHDKGSAIQGYNAQAAVTETQVIVSADLTNDANDTRMLEPMTDTAIKELERLEQDDSPRSSDSPKLPASPDLSATSTEPERPTVLADAGYWNSAQIKALANRGIEVVVPPRSIGPKEGRPRKKAQRQGPWAERMDRLLSTDEGSALYRRRLAMVEPVFGQIKHTRGLKRLSRRGLEACRAEWKLIAATHNLLKLRSAALAA